MLKKLLSALVVVLVILAAGAIVLTLLARPASACPACLRDLPRPLAVHLYRVMQSACHHRA